jgi:hypothetical protein
MAIKKLTFTFEVPITQLLGLIATGNTGLKIDVQGDERAIPKKLLNGHAPKLLTGPPMQERRGGHTQRGRDENGKPAIGWHKMLEALAKNPEHTKTTIDLGHLLETLGLSKKSVSPQISMMQKKGWLKRLEPGVYQMTAKGGVEASRLGFMTAPRKAKKAKPTKSAAAPVEAEQSHG